MKQDTKNMLSEIGLFTLILLAIITVVGIPVIFGVTSENTNEWERIDTDCVMHVYQDKRALWWGDDPETRTIYCRGDLQ